MDEVTTMLQRMRTLSQQSANGSNNTDDRTAIQKEVNQLSSEIDRISSDTTFGGKKILDGNFKGDFQVGADANQKISFSVSFAMTISGIAGSDTTISGFSSGAGNIDVSSASKAQSVLANVDKMIKAVDSKRAALGAVQNRLDSTVRNQSNVSENVSAARSRIRDADFATETANMTKQNILQQAASSVLAQANQRPQSALSLLG